MATSGMAAREVGIAECVRFAGSTGERSTPEVRGYVKALNELAGSAMWAVTGLIRGLRGRPEVPCTSAWLERSAVSLLPGVCGWLSTLDQE